MSNGTAVATMPVYEEDQLSASGLLAASTGSMSSSRHQTSQIAKMYRQAAQLFITRRLPEALSTIEPIITPAPAEDGLHNGSYTEGAPIASASRSSRTKVWNFYLSFLNAVVDLGPEEGKHAFGSTRWKQLVNKARDGTVWEDIVRDGYGGIEGNVDAEVVINLYEPSQHARKAIILLTEIYRATLLLTHSPSQKLNQQRLENYLSALANPSFDITSRLSSQPRLRRTQSGASGTNTPRDLHSNIKLLELYTLHVLPRNSEWEYAREFIMMSEVLDDERKEAFLQALHGLKEEQQESAQREKELQKQQQEQLEQQRRIQEEQRQAEARRAEEEARRREEARKYPHRPPDTSSTAGANGVPPKSSPSSSQGNTRPEGSRASRAAQSKKELTRHRPQPPPKTLYKRAAALFASLQTLLVNTAQSLSSNPMALMRVVLFLLMFALAFGRRDIRERVQRMLRNAWEKVRGTVGMGVKVSYI